MQTILSCQYTASTLVKHQLWILCHQVFSVTCLLVLLLLLQLLWYTAVLCSLYKQYNHKVQTEEWVNSKKFIENEKMAIKIKKRKIILTKSVFFIVTARNSIKFFQVYFLCQFHVHPKKPKKNFIEFFPSHSVSQLTKRFKMYEKKFSLNYAKMCSLIHLFLIFVSLKPTKLF